MTTCPSRSRAATTAERAPRGAQRAPRGGALAGERRARARKHRQRAAAARRQKPSALPDPTLVAPSADLSQLKSGASPFVPLQTPACDLSFVPWRAARKSARARRDLSPVPPPSKEDRDLYHRARARGPRLEGSPPRPAGPSSIRNARVSTRRAWFGAAWPSIGPCRAPRGTRSLFGTPPLDPQSSPISLRARPARAPRLESPRRHARSKAPSRLLASPVARARAIAARARARRAIEQAARRGGVRPARATRRLVRRRLTPRPTSPYRHPPRQTRRSRPAVAPPAPRGRPALPRDGTARFRGRQAPCARASTLLIPRAPRAPERGLSPTAAARAGRRRPAQRGATLHTTTYRHTPLSLFFYIHTDRTERTPP